MRIIISNYSLEEKSLLTLLNGMCYWDEKVSLEELTRLLELREIGKDFVYNVRNVKNRIYIISFLDSINVVYKIQENF